jgi:hypothetical protein
MIVGLLLVDGKRYFLTFEITCIDKDGIRKLANDHYTSGMVHAESKISVMILAILLYWPNILQNLSLSIYPPKLSIGLTEHGKELGPQMDILN